MHLSPDPGIWLAAFLTLCIFSFLYRDNPFYKLAEHLVVGVSAGYWLVILLKQTVEPYLIEPLRMGYWNVVPEKSGLYLLLTAWLLGPLIFFRLWRRWSYIARIPIALVWGIGSGFVVPLALQTRVIRQIQPCMISLMRLRGWDGINDVLIVIGVITSLLYFYFSKEHRGLFGRVANVGIWTLMIGFGATFGFTAMARISLLIGRLDFLMRDWLGILR